MASASNADGEWVTGPETAPRSGGVLATFWRGIVYSDPKKRHRSPCSQVELPLFCQWQRPLFGLGRDQQSR